MAKTPPKYDSDTERTVKDIIDELSQYPNDFIAYAYEGEVCGIIVMDPKNKWKHWVVYTKSH
jgi:hypothetical protein